ncbi:glycerol kinase GlpK [Paenibacillus sp. UNC451MF]|uniref:glycerol kinase GlpK n=1 Tax=Paenibacillus sp. UNC451MF TaxID=1449063 RepID=UPI0004904105|nr:glycerol kinase GlpK [Paenibacillus sp. UNC451MF]
MEKRYILVIDQSTSGTKALIVARSGEIVSRSSAEHKQYYPRPGWVEHDPIEIYERVKQTAEQALQSAGIIPDELAAMTLTNQRETAVLWDPITGLPVHPAIVWQCQRTSEQCARYKLSGLEAKVRSKTGLMLDPYFSATKWAWMLEHAAEAKEKLADGRLLAGTIDSWLLWKLTGGNMHVTDYSNASRTSLYNIHTLSWDEELCELFGVPSVLLPEVKFSDDSFGYTGDPDLLNGIRIPISGIIGDSQAALFGNLCFQPGMAKATYGTGTSVLMNIGEKPPATESGLVSTVAWGAGGKVIYALEAIIRTSGDCIKWVRDNLGLFRTFEEMEQLLRETKDSEGVYLVPAFVGLGAPHWDPDARASISGINRGTHKSHIIRAALESIAYQVYDAVQLIEAESGVPLKELRADGGATGSQLLMQFQADLLLRPVIKSDVAELSAIGSAYMGGLGVGFWSSMEEIVSGLSKRQSYVHYSPQMAEKDREAYCLGWQRAVASVLQRSV